MLHMLRAGSCNTAEQCVHSVGAARYLTMMKTLTSKLCLFLLAGFGANAFAQALAEPARSMASPRPKAADPHKAPAPKDTGVKRGADLRLALTPSNPNPNANVKGQEGLANVSDISSANPPPEHHLNAKERQEIRELLRQQRLKQQEN